MPEPRTERGWEEHIPFRPPNMATARVHHYAWSPSEDVVLWRVYVEAETDDFFGPGVGFRMWLNNRQIVTDEGWRHAEDTLPITKGARLLFHIDGAPDAAGYLIRLNLNTPGFRWFGTNLMQCYTAGRRDLPSRSGW